MGKGQKKFFVRPAPKTAPLPPLPQGLDDWAHPHFSEDLDLPLQR